MDWKPTLRERLKMLRFKTELFFVMWWRLFEEAPAIFAAIISVIVGMVVGTVMLFKFLF